MWCKESYEVLIHIRAEARLAEWKVKDSAECDEGRESGKIIGSFTVGELETIIQTSSKYYLAYMVLSCMNMRMDIC